MKKIFSKLLGGVLLFNLSMSLTSCDPYLDDILGEWSRPTPGGNVTPGGGSSSDEPTPTMEATPLTLEVTTAGTIIVDKPRSGMQYSLNGGAKTPVPAGTAINGGDLNVGDKVAFFGNGTSIKSYFTSTTDYTSITGGTAKVKVFGNIMSLVDETGFAANTELPADDTFAFLFENNAKLTDASGLLLPATTLRAWCYWGMFWGCTGLTTVPEKLLPATELKDGCYASMFKDCKGLTTAPELPATTLTISCYSNMFTGCSNLIATPHLAAPTEALVNNCYQAMFHSCTSLKKAYVKAVYKNTYGIFECDQMFFGCTDASTSTFYSADAGNYKSTFGLDSWQNAAYE